MQFDINRNKPTPNASSECPACKSVITAKCGSIKIWHWAHKSIAECDANWEPTTQWHLDWQAKVPESMREIIIGRHIADIKLSSGKVIEIQHSNLPVEVVQEREQFYGDMTWIFDGQEFYDRLRIKEKLWNGKPSHSFVFKKPRHYILKATKIPFYIDFGKEVFKVKGINEYENHSQEYNKDYTTYFFYGDLKQKNFFLYAEIFGNDYVGN